MSQLNCVPMYESVCVITHVYAVSNSRRERERERESLKRRFFFFPIFMLTFIASSLAFISFACLFTAFQI